MTPKRRTLLWALAAATAPAVRAPSNPKIVFGYTAVTDFASVFVAAEEGGFKRRNLDVELKFIALNSIIPAALQSDSLQIGGAPPPVFFSAGGGGRGPGRVGGGAGRLRHQERAGLRGQEDRRAGPWRLPACDLPRMAQEQRRGLPQGPLR